MSKLSTRRKKPSIEKDWEANHSFNSADLVIHTGTKYLGSTQSHRNILSFHQDPNESFLIKETSCSCDNFADKDNNSEKERLKEGYKQREKRDKEVNTLWKRASKEADERLSSND